MNEKQRSYEDEYYYGYEAGLNGWHYDLSKINNDEYNKGWNAGWKKRYFGDRNG